MKRKKSALGAVAVAVLVLLAWQLVHVTLPADDAPASFYASQYGDNLQKVFLKAIEEAHSSIFIATFALSDREVINALKRKAKSGVHVELIADKKVYGSIKRKLGKDITVRKRTHVKGLMHRKICIIDEKLLFFGSANLTFESLWMHDNLLCGMVSTQMAQAVLNRYRTPEATGEEIFSVGGQEVELWFTPENSGALPRLLQLISTAQKTVRVAMFTFTHPQLTDALIAAHRRGVLVETVVDYRSSLGASAGVVERLKKAGVFVATNTGEQLLHHKFAYIDGHTLCNGSANWTRAAFTQNEDGYIVLAPLTEEQHAYMEKLWRRIILEAQVDTPEEATLLEALGF